MDSAALAEIVGSALAASGGFAAAIWAGIRERQLRQGQERLYDAQTTGVDLANVRAMIDLYKSDNDDLRERLTSAEAQLAQLQTLVTALTTERDSWKQLAERGEQAVDRQSRIVSTALDALVSPVAPPGKAVDP